MLILLAGTLIVIIIYGKIERLRQKSNRYRKYLAHQGIGISFKVIFNYYNNQNFIFILFILFAFHASYDQQFSTTTSYLDFGYFKIQQDQYKIVNGILYVISTLLGSIVSLFLNRKKWIIESSMKATLHLINFQIIFKFIKFLLFLVQIYGQQYQILQALQIFLQVFSNANMIIIFFQYFEAGSSLIDEQSSIKSQGFSLMCNFEFLGICFSSSSLPPLTKLIIQLIILIMANTYTTKYLKNRSFVQLERNLKNYLEKQNYEYEISK
ncbi:transmembrane protein, putative (macronuclear) [Tetrahymena thermophila SB210]|uniref:Transmembrane protein, putative n=1 Tax=Tetrahymena thermophila (strain SB210) TaxID=312017 RepID=W7XFG7_TETTS|nr:transmembrane protein, putative [Tetrahymena thermophila SB210]EWS71534.1 transmembrane protein, putative [Tetrahymena thermophila SB210]|eukprot:XP_012655930.1 transmembrane protein, putative [Tetrahymena thermophila SB210]